MKETFLVKHAVGGRSFIDTAKQPLPYAFKQDGDNWVFKVQTAKSEIIDELLKWKDELNVFVFQVFENEPTRKVWFYVNEGPVYYDEASSHLVIVAQSRIEYIPDQFSDQVSQL
ncbi:hypothetical protein [Paenibacillus sedimenti]|uniref:Uncharacterized protein n=1 Tax=Paenibacillus sedimenti TaxID=2770274 RepID=A0A926QHD9_9BACL|nr:hypothetical protein [Paenibacillus sedimenti]MBD0379436.1 hypothetical protein [Paenibacillus sedimenti]